MLHFNSHEHIHLVERLTLSNINTLFSDPAMLLEREREREREMVADAHTSSQNGCKLISRLNLTIIFGEGGVDHFKGRLQELECSSCIGLLPWIQVDEQNRDLSQFGQPADFVTMVNLQQLQVL